MKSGRFDPTTGRAALEIVDEGVRGATRGGLAAKLMLEAMSTFSFLAPNHVRTIRIILRDAPALKRWQAVLSSMS